jgi:rhodanese-related sulfurtransferase
VPEDRPLITYCNGYGCPDSYDLAVLLLEAGYRRVWVFEGGFPAWRDAGLPAKRGGGQ